MDDSKPQNLYDLAKDIIRVSVIGFIFLLNLYWASGVQEKDNAHKHDQAMELIRTCKPTPLLESQPQR